MGLTSNPSGRRRGKSYAYRQDDPSLWSDANVDNYRLVGEVARERKLHDRCSFSEKGDLSLPKLAARLPFWADVVTSYHSSGRVWIFVGGLRALAALRYGTSAGFVRVDYVPVDYVCATLHLLPARSTHYNSIMRKQYSIIIRTK